MEDARRCPRCHSDEVLPIAYGLPSPEMVEESMAGRVKLAGCMVWPDESTSSGGFEKSSWRCAENLHVARRPLRVASVTVKIAVGFAHLRCSEGRGLRIMGYAMVGWLGHFTFVSSPTKYYYHGSL